ncbi:hypothetical protein GCM10011514_29190 [Emticicia aquatilis]|uniref:Signal transduction histidine kinase internal region domain-containing protein n=2 Tax=Emticicia aquatilis TaxID=1537369 RepID=A0A917DST4_9BACT|nr:hypothetical protein GCM10011514_29190 [Emticicia aquatilis]
MEFSFGNIFTKAYWKETVIPFAKKHWIIIVAVLTAISVAHTIWYFSYSHPLSTIVDDFFKATKVKGSTRNYSRWYKLGYLVAAFLGSKSFFFSLIGTTILIAEFNFQFLFKNLFVDEGRKGKFFYFIVLVFFYFFIFVILLTSFGIKAEPLGLHTFITNIWIGFSVIYSVIQYVSESHKRLRELAVQKTKVELSALKAQINPHFLFNVLNNLYGTAIVEDSPKTAEGIQQLSSIMRHVVEGTKNERISAEKEVQFLYDFIELNKMRIPKRDNIKIKINIDYDEQPTQIAPLLVIPYIENAFKYGISITQESFIEIDFNIENQKLHFLCRNSIIKQFDKLEVGTSTGLENTRRRLTLNYPHRHTLKISNKNNIFEVVLDVDLK